MFNFQGAFRHPFGRLYYYITSQRLCQVLFQNFLKFSFQPLRATLPSRTAYILYHFLEVLSSGFSNFFEKIFQEAISFAVRISPRQLIYCITFLTESQPRLRQNTAQYDLIIFQQILHFQHQIPKPNIICRPRGRIPPPLHRLSHII